MSADAPAEHPAPTLEPEPYESAQADGPAPPLPDDVRAAVVTFASDALGALEPDSVPLPLRRLARFAPAKRAKLVATPLAAALESDPAFRQAVAARVTSSVPALAAALHAGTPPQAADPVTVAAAAYLLRPRGWQSMLANALAAIEEQGSSGSTARAEAEATRLREQLTDARAEARAELDRIRAELRTAKTEVAELRHKLRATRDDLRAAQAGTQAAREAADEAKATATGATSASEAEVRRLRARLADAEAVVEAARRAARGGRSLDDARVRLLLDTLVDAAQGMRRELALPPTTLRPADTVQALSPGVHGVDDVAIRALRVDDPAQFDDLLALPQVHLVVDGYNVTKTGYGALPLEAQRARLIAGLNALAARSGAEVTVCFDGAALEGPVPSMTSRGVRVLFSAPGETADELIRRLVRNEPQGRPVVVVSTDREVADGVRRVGARAVPSTALLRRLERG